MPQLKLPKLPDRTPIKITIAVAPELNAALLAYAELYRLAYGEVEPVAELIPYMLERFLAADRGFAMARKQQQPGGKGLAPLPKRQPARRSAEAIGPSPTAEED